MTVDWGLEPTGTAELEALSLLIRETTGSVLAFALYRSVAEREAAVRAMKERLSVPLVEFTLSKVQDNPIELIHSLPVDKRVCILLYDLEEALPKVTCYLNLQRESIVEVPHAIIFWIREYGLQELATRAPDFWAWRSGVFDFRTEAERVPGRAIHAILGEPVYFQDRGDLERKISLYQGLIAEHSQPEPRDERFVARLKLRLVDIFLMLGQFAKAEQYLVDVTNISEQIEDAELRAASAFYLGTLALEKYDLDDAEKRYQAALDIVRQLSDESYTAAVYHQFGIIAHKGQQFDQAEEWYRKALEIFERLGLERHAASDYHQLGIIAQERQQFDRAEEWYRKALEIFERLGLEREAADEYHQLGNVCYLRQQFDRAEEWYRKALEIFERLGLERDAADDYHQLGMIAQERQQSDRAEEWYRKALEISERLGLERYAADEYHQLGMIAQERQQFDRAEEWYRKALEIFEQLNHPPLLVETLAQFGQLRGEQQRYDEAVAWFGRAFFIAQEYRMRVIMQVLSDLLKLLTTMGEGKFRSAWQEHFPGREPPLAMLKEIAKQTGEES